MKDGDGWVPSPHHSSQQYHEQGQDENDGAVQVGMVMGLQLVVWAVDELKGHLFLGRSPDTPQIHGYRYEPRGTLETGSLDAAAPSYLFLIPSIQVPVQDHAGALPLPDLQKHCGCSEHRGVSQHTWGEPR